MTTRRTPPAVPGARSPCSEERVGRRWLLGPPLAPAVPGSGFGLALGLGGVLGASFSARGARAVPWPKPARCWITGCAAALAAPLAAALGLGLPVSAASASFSSTAVAAAFTSSPYAFRRLRTSGRGIWYCLASSWTRFLAMFGLSLRCPVIGK